MSSDFILRVENISLTYKSRINAFNTFTHKALDDISFTLKRGDKLGVLGRNGSGKSSLLRILAGIMRPTSGQVVCPQGVKRSLLTLGLGFKADLTGRDNAVISAMLQGYSRKDAKAMLMDIQEFSELGEFFNRPMFTYSAGMCARLGFATALYTEVDLLLIDEALSVGDANFKEKAEAAMNDKLHEAQSLIFVSHMPNQMEKICHQAIWLNGGVIQESGAIGDVSKQYKKLPS